MCPTSWTRSNRLALCGKIKLDPAGRVLRPAEYGVPTKSRCGNTATGNSGWRYTRGGHAMSLSASSVCFAGESSASANGSPLSPWSAVA